MNTLHQCPLEARHAYSTHSSPWRRAERPSSSANRHPGEEGSVADRTHRQPNIAITLERERTCWSCSTVVPTRRPDVVRSLAARYPTLDVARDRFADRKGGAVRAGLTLGSEPFVAFVDADGSTAARQIDMLLDQCVRAGAAGAIGSRWIAGAAIGRKQPWRRRRGQPRFQPRGSRALRPTF